MGAAAAVADVAAQCTVHAAPCPMPHQRQVERGDVGEPHEELRVAPGSSEIEPVGDAKRALAALGGEDGADLLVTDGLVEVGEALVVGAGEVVELVEALRP